ncbi:hypothetical protein LWI29_005766 [Acer saccharum]|uniref:Uncharacterized protein n=1 Tax=Acer saccharum TaxID=4024 RepID=A0AA39RVA5_ACESA|nr:hypothetical protein LWI29_005766 [Acer saccharum]
MELTIKENKFEEVERVADYILNLIIGRYDAETGRRKGSRDGAEAGRRETGGGLGGSEGSGSRRAEKPNENDLKYQKIEEDIAIEILKGVVLTVEFSKKGPKIENAEKIVKELESILKLIGVDRKPKW